MTINHVYKIVKKVMEKLDNIDFLNINIKKANQKNLNDAYKILDEFKDELIRERIKSKQGGTNE
jgi:hypothetical protein